MSSFNFGFAARLTAGAALGCALIGAAGAQAPIAPPLSATAPAAAPTLAQAAEAAWQRASQAREAEGQMLRATAERVAASGLWAAPPALEISHRSDRWQTAAGAKETEAGLSWPLWLPGQRHARGAAVDAEVEMAQAAVQAGRLHFAGLVREAAWGVASQQTEADLVEAQVRSVQDIANDVNRRVRAGDLAHADALIADSEVLAAQSALLAVRQRLQASQAHWTTLTGLSQLPDLARAAVLPSASSTATQSMPLFVVETHPEMRLAAMTVERARKRLDVVAATQRDPTELLFRIRQDVAGRGAAAQNSLAVGLRVPLGTEGRNQPLQAAALSELGVAQTVKQRTEERVMADVATAQAAVKATEQQLDTDRQRVALLRERASLLERSFKAGETSLPELLRALAAATQAETSFTRQQLALGLTRARLAQSLGILP